VLLFGYYLKKRDVFEHTSESRREYDVALAICARFTSVYGYLSDVIRERGDSEKTIPMDHRRLFVVTVTDDRRGGACQYDHRPLIKRCGA